MDYLLGKGMSLVAQNYISPYGEADIILKDGDEFAFVEVKARRSDKFGKPAEAVTKSKMKKYLLTAQYFFMNAGMEDYRVRFDVAEVYLTSDSPWVNYIQNAYDFSGIEEFY